MGTMVNNPVLYTQQLLRDLNSSKRKNSVAIGVNYLL